MRWCEICRWYTKEREHIVYCKKRDVLFHYNNCGLYDPVELFLFGVSKRDEAPKTEGVKE